MGSADVLIVGAGLAGLCCARRLLEANVSVLLVESADAVGGRVRTDAVEGFRLDRGFQVLLTAYPEARGTLDYKALDLRAFEPGALVRMGQQFRRVTDPWRRPKRALEGLLSEVGTLPDKLRIAWLRSEVCRGSSEDSFSGPEGSTLDFLRARGFSPSIIERFFRPFLGGIFLERELRTSNRMFRFVFRMLALGDTSVPALGMQQIPIHLASAIPQGNLRLRTRVESIGNGRVRLSGREEVEARRIVVATEGPEAGRLLGDTGSGSRHVTCFYFAADRAPVTEPILVLNGEGDGPINNLSVSSVLAPEVAPPGAALISATVLDHGHLTPEQLEVASRAQLTRWFGVQVSQWRLLRTYRIAHAQPDPSLTQPTRPPRVAPNVYVCGDHCRHASIEGAMASGRAAAEAVLADLSA